MVKNATFLATVFLLSMTIAVSVPLNARATERDRNVARTPLELRQDEFQIDPDIFHARVGEKRKIRAVPLPGHGRLVTLELTRFRVFAQGAKIVVHTDDGDIPHPIPNNIYYRGKIEGEPNSTVVLSMLEGAHARGLVVASGRYWILSGDMVSKSSASRIHLREVDSTGELDHEAQGFECAADKLEIPPSPAVHQRNDSGDESFLKAASYTAKIAVETDYEFFTHFGNVTDATNYVADIIAFGSAIYSAEVNTSWILTHLSLWDTSSDPWGQSSTACGLYEFGRYWNSNHADVARTTAAFFSGKDNGGGIAWVGVLCRGRFGVDLDPDDGGTIYPRACPSLMPEVDYYGGAYAYIGDMDGNFTIENPNVVWDIVAATHEIGHNFSSPHTHCYENVGGNSNPVDECYAGQCGTAGCYCGGTSWPSGCPGAGNGCGTIMSYCHLLSGGLSNISLTLGLGHQYGVEPERVPAQMFSHVVARASSYPSCLELVIPDSIFTDGFASGDVSAWTSCSP